MAKKETYNDMILNLQEVLTSLEDKELNLEDAMKEYEIGVKLVNKLYKTLNTLEGKLTVVKENVEVEMDDGNNN